MVLNWVNPAFGPGTPWQQGVNCETFDGSADGLAGLLRDLWLRRQSISQEGVTLTPPAVPYWCRVAGKSSSKRSPATRGALSIVVAIGDEFGDPLDTVRSAVLVDKLDINVILVLALSPSAPDGAAVLERIKGSTLACEGRLKIISLGFNGGVAALCNRGLREVQTEFMSRAGATIDATFLSDAVQALEAEPDYDFVVLQFVFEGRTSDDHPFYVDNVRIGEALNSGVVHNLLGAIEMIGRRSAVADLGLMRRLIGMLTGISTCERVRLATAI